MRGKVWTGKNRDSPLWIALAEARLGICGDSTGETRLQTGEQTHIVLPQLKSSKGLAKARLAHTNLEKIEDSLSPFLSSEVWVNLKALKL